eukprot:3627363-Pyramimonas_sp.AAC.1
MSKNCPSATPARMVRGGVTMVNAHLSHYYWIGVVGALLCWTTITSNGFRTTPKYDFRRAPISIVECIFRHRAPQ